MDWLKQILEKAKALGLLLAKIYAAAVAGDWLGVWELTKMLLALLGISI